MKYFVVCQRNMIKNNYNLRVFCFSRKLVFYQMNHYLRNTLIRELSDFSKIFLRKKKSNVCKNYSTNILQYNCNNSFKNSIKIIKKIQIY